MNRVNPKANIIITSMSQSGHRQWIGDDEPVRIVEYDPAWSDRFESERAALDVVIGIYAVGAIHHVGSTAVPGLAAKPVIDILVGVSDLETARPCIALVAELGYQYTPYLSTEMHWFCKPDPRRRTHQLHLVPVSSERFWSELAFRDHLRAHPEVAARYAEIKRALAATFQDDREAYTEAKAPFIADVLRQARPGSPITEDISNREGGDGPPRLGRAPGGCQPEHLATAAYPMSTSAATNAWPVAQSAARPRTRTTISTAASKRARVARLS